MVWLCCSDDRYNGNIACACMCVRGREASGESLRRWLGPRLKPRTALERRSLGRLKPPRTPYGASARLRLGCQVSPDCFQPAEARASGGPERFHRSLNPRPKANAWRLWGPVAGSACASGLGPGLTPRREAGASLSIEPEQGRGVASAGFHGDQPFQRLSSWA